MIKQAMLYDKLDNDRVQCNLCAHCCKISLDSSGICGVRKNENGELYTLVYGDVIASHVDPIEKKPLYHFLPGSYSYSIATIGCNFKCSFCQNWEISQASKRQNTASGHELMPEEVVREAKKNDCKSISYTYTEPTIFFEYAYETAKLAKKQGLYNIFVTNGYMTKETLNVIKPYLDAANIDLKSFREDFYKEMCGAHLKPVLDTIELMKKLGIWIEITTLVVTGKNDSDNEFKDIAEFIANLDPDIPWHISRFHPDFKYLEGKPTPIDALKRARDIGKKAGLRNIHLGNVIEV
ncbi:MAG: AmmeMemoRadiSam system radical SAM enzyme [Candidatus Omnitrophica bacterium]|nr:AmmeMemoRadiSam system radical SAM enzyme [Candidatus Omnitrophota bacterium]